MKKSKFSDLQVAYALQQYNNAGSLVALPRANTMSDRFAGWKDWYSGLMPSKRRNPQADARQLKNLEAENVRLRRLVLDLSPGADIAQLRPRKPVREQ